MTEDNEIIHTLIKALEHLQVDTRDEAARLISMWHHRDQLTDEQLAQVLNRFPGEPDR